MPVEAIHMSAFVDSQRAAALPAWLAEPALHELGRLGCIVIDFPYFNRFPTGVARYLLKLPTAVSSVGEALHHGQPALVARSMLDHARSLLAHDQAAGRRVLALALGFVSHLAIDATIHPFVNRQAIARATRIGDSPLRQHSEVEKFHSVLFHEERNGFDFMGTFRAVYDEGVAASARAMEAGFAYVERGDEQAFLRDVPQGAIDDLLPAAVAA